MGQLAVWNLTSYDTLVMLDDVPWHNWRAKHNVLLASF